MLNSNTIYSFGPDDEFFPYGPNFAFCQRPRAINRRLVIKQYAHAHAFLLYIISCVKSVRKHSYHNLAANGYQMICSFPTLWERRSDVRPKFNKIAVNTFVNHHKAV